MTLLAEFFSDPNRVRPGDTDTTSQLAERSCGDPTGLVVLPWRDSEGMMRWYVLTPTESLERLREEVVAHAGISYTNYRGQPTSLDEDDIGDQAVSDLVDDRSCIRVDLVVDEKGHVVSKAFGRLLTLWDIRPVREFRSRKGAAEAIHSYRMAIRALRRVEAEEALEDLRQLGFGTINVRFMELELRSRFDGPASVLDHPQLNDLLRIKRPALVTDLLAQAIDRVHLRPTPDLDLESVRGNFDQLPPVQQQLLTSPGQIRSSSGLLLLALRYSDLGEDPATLVAQVVADIERDDHTGQIINGLGAQFETTTTREDSTTDINCLLRELLSRGAYDEVLKVAEDADPVFEVVQSVLLAAAGLDSLDAARKALDVLARASDEVRERMSELQSAAVKALQELTRESAPRPLVGDWNDYFENLTDNPDWSTALEVAERGASEWPLVPFINDAECVDSLCSHILTGGDSAVFARTIPFLLGWLSRVPEQDHSAVTPVEEALVAHLSLSDATQPGLDLVGQLAERLVTFGLDETQFEELVAQLEYRWSISKAPRTVAWATDLIELTTDNPCPDRARATVFHSGLFQSFNDFFSRLERPVRRHIVALAEELGLGELLPDEGTEEDAPVDVRGYKVGLYSLTETALRRAKETLMGAWPGLDVVTSSDMHATRELTNLARTATLMVVGIGSAKHSATDCIGDNRPSDKPTRKVSGKGSMAFVREVEEWLQEVS
jgi:hypothetical protein